MRKQLTFLLFLFLSNHYFLQAQTADYSRVKIFLDKNNTIEKLAKLGIEVDHGQYDAGRFVINDFSKNEIQSIENQGFKIEILIDDVKKYYVSQSCKADEEARIDWLCGSPYSYPHTAPKNFKLGSMAGFYTYQEMLDIFADMQAKYPNLITKVAPIDTFKTVQNRPIYWLKISDNPNKKETAEKSVLYTALHHAREPSGLSQMVYYIWYLLENYDKSQEIKYLVDNTELYFIPCVNPDGYVYNEKTDPKGGGFWRKNRRKNADGSVGVDLNRNYGLEWGKNDIGSSSNGDSETYRGAAAFSEAETQAVKWLTENNNFVAALNYHSYGNDLIYPWAYNDKLADSSFFHLAKILTRYNAFTYGTSIETVGYNVNGDSDDWMYAQTKTLAYTPEVGQYGFWPASFAIQGICADNLYQNLALAAYANHSAILKNQSSQFTNGYSSKIDFEVQNMGLENGKFTVSVKALSNNIASFGVANQQFNLALFEKQNAVFPFQVNANAKIGERLKFLLSIDNQNFIHYDTVTMTLQSITPLLLEKGNNLLNFEAAPSVWGVTTKTFATPPASITDSPDGNYSPDEITSLTTANYVKLPSTGKIVLRFAAKWEIERNHDYAMFSVFTSDNPGFSQSLCGRYTHASSIANLGFELPIYDGKSDWVQEEIDITEYAGKSIKIRFELSSDAINEYDGLYIDDIQIWAGNTIVSSIDELAKERSHFTLSPNPASNELRIGHLVSSAEKNITFSLFDVSGKEILRNKLQNAYNEEIINIENIQSGIYFYKISNENRIIKSDKIIILK